MLEITVPTLAVMFSGGLDSLGALYKVLTDSSYSQYAIHAHHIHLKNYQERDAAEDIAVKAILEAMTKIPTLREVTYSESTFEFPSISKVVIWDADAVNFIASNLVYRFPLIQKLALGVSKDDNSGFVNQDRFNKSRALYAILAAPETKIYPVKEMTKQEIWDMLPNELRKLAWSCRTPNKINDKYVPCGGCRSCVVMTEIMRVK